MGLCLVGAAGERTMPFPWRQQIDIIMMLRAGILVMGVAVPQRGEQFDEAIIALVAVELEMRIDCFMSIGETMENLHGMICLLLDDEDMPINLIRARIQIAHDLAFNLLCHCLFSLLTGCLRRLWQSSHQLALPHRSASCSVGMRPDACCMVAICALHLVEAAPHF